MKEYTTKTKLRLLELLQANRERQMAAAEVYEQLSAEDPKLNLTTVYRNLDRMTVDGVLMKYKARDGRGSVYQFVGDDHDCHHHLHLQCYKCGRMIHLDCHFMKEITEHLLEHHDFLVECEGSVIMGLCSDCRKKHEVS